MRDLEECKLNFPNYTKIDNLDPSSTRYRACIHLNLTYYLAKFIGKPFLLYKVENYKRLNENNGYESAFVDHLSSICIDAAFCSVELLSNYKNITNWDYFHVLTLMSVTLPYCHFGVLKIDRSETTLLFLRKV